MLESKDLKLVGFRIKESSDIDLDMLVESNENVLKELFNEFGYLISDRIYSGFLAIFSGLAVNGFNKFENDIQDYIINYTVGDYTIINKLNVNDMTFEHRDFIRYEIRVIKNV